MKKYRVTHPIPGYQAGDPIKAKDKIFSKYLKLGLIAEIARPQSKPKTKKVKEVKDGNRPNHA